MTNKRQRRRRPRRRCSFPPPKFLRRPPPPPVGAIRESPLHDNNNRKCNTMQHHATFPPFFATPTRQTRPVGATLVVARPRLSLPPPSAPPAPSAVNRPLPGGGRGRFQTCPQTTTPPMISAALLFSPSPSPSRRGPNPSSRAPRASALPSPLPPVVGATLVLPSPAIPPSPLRAPRALGALLSPLPGGGRGRFETCPPPQRPPRPRRR